MAKTVKTYHWSDIVSTNDTETKLTLPVLRKLNIMNTGQYPVEFEIDNAIEVGRSIVLPVNVSYPAGPGVLDIRYRTAPAHTGEASQLTLAGLKQTKDLN